MRTLRCRIPVVPRYLREVKAQRRMRQAAAGEDPDSPTSDQTDKAFALSAPGALSRGESSALTLQAASICHY